MVAGGYHDPGTTSLDAALRQMAALDVDGFCRWLDIPTGLLVELDGGPPGETTDIEVIAMAAVAALDIGALCRWLGEPEGELVALGPLPTGADQVALLIAGDHARLTHVEFVLDATEDLPSLMLASRVRVMRQPEFSRWALHQHVIVLRHGRIDDTVTDGDEFTLELDLHYLRDDDPEVLLRSPALAALAPAARSESPEQRAQILARALVVVRAGTSGDTMQSLAGAAVALAGFYLDADTVRAVWNEAGMPIDIMDSPIVRDAFEVGYAEGYAGAFAQAQLEGSAEILETFLRSRFGPDPRIPAVAAAMAARPLDEAPERLAAATTLDDLIP